MEQTSVFQRVSTQEETYRILVVDDDPDCGEFLWMALERRQCKVVLHTKPEDALAWIKTNPGKCDMVVTDHLMPGIYGLDLIAEIKALYPDLPCILCSGFSKNISRIDLNRAGVHAFFNKPIDTDALWKVIKEAVSHRTDAANSESVDPAGSSVASAGLLDRSAIVDVAPVGIFSTEADGAITFANRTLLALCGYPVSALTGRDWTSCLASNDTASDLSSWKDTCVKNGLFHAEFMMHRSNGTVLWVEVHASVQRDWTGAVTGYVGVVIDSSNHREALARAEFLAQHSALTGLPNRVLTRDRFRLAASFAERTNSKVAMAMLDLDYFKVISDTLGQNVGDTFLRTTAERLVRCIYDTDTVCHLGGDKFLLLLPQIQDSDALSMIMDKIQAHVAVPTNISGHEINSSVSIGVAVFPDDGADFEALLGKAEIALNQAKTSGSNIYRFYTQHMNVNALRHLEIRNGLRQALKHQEFVLHYQPIIDAGTDVLCGAEALIRWNHKGGRMIPPDEFIPIAEESGLIVEIGEWALNEACAVAAAWQSPGTPPLFVSVNISVAQFSRCDLVGAVAKALERSGLPPELLVLELTESIMILDNKEIVTTIERLKDMGVELSIDDFGTGYSSLAYLRHLKVDKLKIDKSFVTDMRQIPENAAIVKGIIQMSRSLNLHSVAEGIEDSLTLETLKELGCEYAQGYFIGRPMPHQNFEEIFVAKHMAAV